MTYKESFSQCKNLQELKDSVKRETKVALIIGNPDRVYAIEKAMNETIKEKGWENYE